MKIKGFDKDLKCRGFQFEIGKVYDTGAKDEDLKLCSDTVFHYCDNLQKVHRFYNCADVENRYCEIEVLGRETTDGEKCGSNKIRIIREITNEELKQLKGLINGNAGLFNTGNRNTGNYNTGDCNTGYYNTGDCNTGNRNTGNRNTGDCNTGYYNTGYYNTGNRNTGDCNTGNYNTGDCNTGNRNTGDCNTGYYNTGYYNTGNRNTGNRNTGDCNTGNYNTGNYNTGNRNTGDCNTGNYNTGNYNTGYYNTGNRNTGDCNTGNCNTGNYNTGNRNTGNYNKCDYSNGFFNTLEDKDIMIFNKKSGMSTREFLNSKYYKTLTSVPFILTKWVRYSDEEKKKSKEKELIGGYLKKYSYKEACANWWKEMSEENKEIIKSIPNFDAEIFKEITGIEV